MKQEIAVSSKANLDDALKEIFSQLRNPQYKIVIFFASSIYNFEELSQKMYSHFSNCCVIGTSTSGELTNKGFTNSTLTVTAMIDATTKVSGLLIDDAVHFPIVYRKEIENAANSVGIRTNRNGVNKDAFAITFINGLCNAEESVLAVINTVIGDDSFKIIGGTAGDDLQFKQTNVSFNGKCTTKGAAIVFVKTTHKFIIEKENIFKSVGHTAFVTGIEAETRTITSLDNKSPVKRYSELLGIEESKANDAIFFHPFGRVFGNEIFISSIVGFNNNGSATLYSRILPGVDIEVLEPIDEVEKAQETCVDMLNKISRPGFVLFVNCIFRTIEYQRHNTTNKIVDTWKKYFPMFAGLSSYGEQINRLHSNQTLVALIIEE